MGYMQAQGFQNRFCRKSFRHVKFRGKQEPLFHQLMQFAQYFPQLCFFIKVLQRRDGFLIIISVKYPQNVIGRLIKQVHSAAIDVQHRQVLIYLHPVNQFIIHNYIICLSVRKPLTW